jgi:starch phosphorylase
MLGNDFFPPRRDTYYNGLAYYVRENLIGKWLSAQRSFYSNDAKRVYYLSMEFLPGRFLKNYVLNLQLEEECMKALEGSGFTLEDLEEEESDPGLGNGGLGRLASCYMDSMASLNISGYGYGIRYDYGIFNQAIRNGCQIEECDNWLRKGNPWEIARRNFLSTVCFYGRSESYTDETGRLRYRWVNTDKVNAMACDTLIPGWGSDAANNMRLWAATSSRAFNMQFYNQGDYIRAMEAKVLTENISKVLYPSDEEEQGKELRLKQQYFFVAATFEDIMRRFTKHHNGSFKEFPERVAVQLNDTHPSISIPELMRLLMDEQGLGWDEAWDICVKTFAYTNHTVLPEALESWPVKLMSRLLPRHMEIIYEINHRFLEEVARRYPEDNERLSRMSLIYEGRTKRVRMAYLAIVGSHSVNGVAALHTRILKESLFKDFDEFFPGRFINITNGITQRRWLLQANPGLSELITSVIGPGWIHDLSLLKGLIPFARDEKFRASWQEAKRKSKKLLAEYILRSTGISVQVDSLFDIQTKRIHEYKRQLLNVLHVITLYNRFRQNPEAAVPRTVIFGGKAAPGYFMAKLAINLINSVAQVVNTDPLVKGKLKVAFLPNYCVSQAEKIIPAADLSEQISTAGMEASGTGNMKFALNGALTMGTLDGANIEIMEEVGGENIFIFGLTVEEVSEMRSCGYNPRHYYDNDPELRQAVDMIGSGHFSAGRPDLFAPVSRALLDEGDHYFVMADYRSYIQAQERAGKVYLDREEWTRRSIMNTANMGKFSSDRAVMEYADKIWKVKAGRK